MNRNWNRRAMGGLPILSAAMLSAIGLMWEGARSGAAAQTYSGPSSEVVVNYDVLNALPGQSAPYGAQTLRPDTQPKSQFLPGYAPTYNPGGVTALPPYSPYGTVPPVGAQPLAGLATPPAGSPSSVLTTLGPDGRPLTPIKLKKPGTQTAAKPKKKTDEYAAPVQKPQAPDADTAAEAPSEAQVAAATPPAEPAEVPAKVPMPEATPQAPAPGVNDETPPPAPAVAAAAPAAETPTPPAEQPAQADATATPAPAPAAAPAEPAATQEAAKTPQPPAEGEPAKTEEQPAEEATAETPPPAPDNNQPAPPIPQGGIRIVFPTDLNEVPAEANSALDDLATQMQADENMRIQIMCYASGTEDTESKARRKSLARCINIRQYLFKKDIRTTRMDVRALGLKSEGQPADRVDIVPANS